MKSSHRALASLALTLCLAACSTTYKPPKLDTRTGLYEASSTVDPGGVRVPKSTVTASQFSAVLLVAASNDHPSRLEFVTRAALADLGVQRVVNVAEFRQWAEDEHFTLPADKLTLDTIKAFSAQVKPVLIVDVRYGWRGGPAHIGALTVADGRTGTVLLAVDHPKTVWASVDGEVIYPVLNELRKWYRSIAGRSA